VRDRVSVVTFGRGIDGMIDLLVETIHKSACVRNERWWRGRDTSTLPNYGRSTNSVPSPDAARSN
jgi:hypothetical protein